MGARRYTRTSVEYSEITSGTILDWTQDATWMFWVYPESEPAFTIFGVASVWHSSSNWWWLRCTDLISGNDNLTFGVNGDSSQTNAEGTAILNSGTWSHIAIVRSGDTWTVYVDAVSDITFSKDLNGTPSKVIEGNTYNPDAGGAANTTESFDGRFAASKAWQAALTVQEIRSEMKRVHPVRLANLHEFWPAENDTRKFSGRAKGINWTGVNTPTYEEGPPLQIRGIQPLLIIPAAAGGTTHLASAALTGEGTMTAAGALTAAGAASLSGEGTLASNGVLVAAGSSSLTGEGTMAAAGQLTAAGAATLSGEGILGAAATSTLTAAAAFAGEGTMTAGAALTAAGAATLSGEGTLASTCFLTAAGAAALTGEGTLAAAALATYAGASSLIGEGLLTADGIVFTPGASSSASLSGEGLLTASAAVVRYWLTPPSLGATIAGSSAGASRIPSTSLRGTYP